MFAIQTFTKQIFELYDIIRLPFIYKLTQNVDHWERTKTKPTDVPVDKSFPFSSQGVF